MGFVGGLFGANNDTKGQVAGREADVNNTDYTAAVQQAINNTSGQGNAQAANYGQQSALANQLFAESQGQGPNLANEQLKQATNQNIASGNSQISSIKGINPEVAALAKAGNTAQQNQAAGSQSSVNRAQQQLSAQQQLGGVLGQQGSQAIGQEQVNNQNLATIGGLQNTQNANQINNSLAAQGITANAAAQNSGFAQNLTGGFLGSLGSALTLAEGGEVPQNPKFSHVQNIPVKEWLNALHDTGITHPDQIRRFALGGESLGVDMSLPNAPSAAPANSGPSLGVDTSMPMAPANSNANFVSALGVDYSPLNASNFQTPAIGSSNPPPANVPSTDKGGFVAPSSLGGGSLASSIANQSVMQGLAAGAKGGASMANIINGKSFKDEMSSLQSMMPSGGGGKGGSPGGGGGADAAGGDAAGGAGADAAGADAAGGAASSGAGDAALLALAASGGQIPGQADVDGDSEKNDKVPALLSPKEIVLPRSVTMSKNPEKAAASFVEAVKRSHKPDEKVEFKHVLDAHKNLSDRLARIEKMCGGGMPR